MEKKGWKSKQPRSASATSKVPDELSDANAQRAEEKNDEIKNKTKAKALRSRGCKTENERGGHHGRPQANESEDKGSPRFNKPRQKRLQQQQKSEKLKRLTKLKLFAGYVAGKRGMQTQTAAPIIP